MYPSVIKVVPKDNYQIYVEFDNKECGVLNMKPYLDFGVFRKIKDLNLFSKVRVSFDTIEWGNGIDLDPQFVYEKCIKEKRLTNKVRLYEQSEPQSEPLVGQAQHKN